MFPPALSMPFTPPMRHPSSHQPQGMLTEHSQRTLMPSSSLSPSCSVSHSLSLIPSLFFLLSFPLFSHSISLFLPLSTSHSHSLSPPLPGSGQRNSQQEPLMERCPGRRAGVSRQWETHVRENSGGRGRERDNPETEQHRVRFNSGALSEELCKIVL